MPWRDNRIVKKKSAILYEEKKSVCGEGEIEDKEEMWGWRRKM